MQGVVSNTESLPLMEAFYTIQGEGAYQGKAAYFIRLGGCDVGCVWCDVKESWDANAHPQITIKNIVQQAANFPSRIAVVTGGEPTLYALEGLTNELHRNGFRTHIETSGTNALSGNWDWVCVSPKKFKAPLPEVLQKADELKVIIFNKSDFAWAEKHAAMVSADCKLYLQPEWSKASKMVPLMVDYIKANPQWQLCLQIHKYIDVP